MTDTPTAKTRKPAAKAASDAPAAKPRRTRKPSAKPVAKPVPPVLTIDLASPAMAPLVEKLSQIAQDAEQDFPDLEALTPEGAEAIQALFEEFVSRDGYVYQWDDHPIACFQNTRGGVRTDKGETRSTLEVLKEMFGVEGNKAAILASEKDLVTRAVEITRAVDPRYSIEKLISEAVRAKAQSIITTRAAHLARNEKTTGRGAVLMYAKADRDSRIRTAIQELRLMRENPNSWYTHVSGKTMVITHTLIQKRSNCGVIAINEFVANCRKTGEFDVSDIYQKATEWKTAGANPAHRVKEN